MLSLGGCDRNTSAPTQRKLNSATLSDEEIIATLNKRAGSQACCVYAGRDKNGHDVYGPIKPRELHFMVRRRRGDEEIVCGYSGFPPFKAFNGQYMSSGFDTIFVVRGRRLYLREDVGDEQFDRMQDQLCGPDWVKPLPGKLYT